MTTQAVSQKIILSIIAAIASNNAIGKNNQLPWPHCAEDMNFFKQCTKHKSIIMGYRTFLSLNSTPLPNRYNVVLKAHVKNLISTSDKLIFVGNCEQALKQAQQYAEQHQQSEIMIIGGGAVYKQFLPLVQRLYITHFAYTPVNADVFFPDFTIYQWKKQELQRGMCNNGMKYCIIRYDKIDFTD